MTLPYPEPDGRAFTAGWSGSSASHDRALAETESTAARRQAATMRALQIAGPIGLTWFELADGSGWHHGQASSVLSVLHKEGRISRLKLRRGRSSVYVLHGYVNGREIALPGRTANNSKSYAAGYADGFRDGRAS